MFGCVKSSFLTAGIVLAISSFSAHAGPEDAKSRADFQRRLESVDTLFKALERDDEAKGSEVKAALATVAARRKEAEDMAAVGEFDIAQSILTDGYKLLQATLMKAKQNNAAYKGATGSAVVDDQSEQKKQKFTREVQSSKALLDAAKRSDSETGGKHAADVSRVAATIAKGEAAFAKGQYVEAEQINEGALKELRVLFVSIKAQPGDAGLKPASAAADTTGGKDNEIKRKEIDRELQATKMLRPVAERMGKEKGIDNAAALARIDKLTAEARTLQASDASSALSKADEAYKLVKETIDQARAAK